MAETADGAINDGPYRLVELLSSAGRDFLVRRNGDQISEYHQKSYVRKTSYLKLLRETSSSSLLPVYSELHEIGHLLASSVGDWKLGKVKINDLKGKVVDLYFSASWCGPCRRFTPDLVSAYEVLAPKGDFEVVFISADEDHEKFDEYFSKMPWLAIPFSDSDTRSSLDQIFEVSGIPHLVILDGNGKQLTDEGTMMIGEHGAESYPFSTERMQELKAEEEAARNNQSLKSILINSTRDFLIYNDGRKVPVTELEGKTVGLLFSAYSFEPCEEFIPQLVEVYNKLKEKNFEIVMISLDMNIKAFNEGLEAVPWPSLPFNDKTCKKLPRYFEIEGIPTLVIIGPDGKTLQSDVVEAIENHGAEAYPFTLERMTALLEIEKARLASQTIESLLVSDERDFVIGNGGLKVPVSDLVGKAVLLYFSAHWCPPCRAFSPKLIETYHKIKAKDSAFEIIFISSDHDQAAFEEYFATMPFLALPYGDMRKKSLSKTFKVTGIPTLVAIGPNGRTLTTDARSLVAEHGAAAYPFTEERLKKLEQETEEMAQAEDDAQDDQNGAGHEKQDESSNEAWVCDGEVCRKA